MKKFVFWSFISIGFFVMAMLPISLLPANIGRALMRPFVGEKIILSDVEEKAGDLVAGVSTCADIEAFFDRNGWNWSKSTPFSSGYAASYRHRFGKEVVYQPPIAIFSSGIILEIFVDDECILRKTETSEFVKA